MSKNIEKSLLVEPKFQLINAAICRSIMAHCFENNRPFQITCFKQFTKFESNDMSFLDTLGDIFVLNIENYALETLDCSNETEVQMTVGFGDSPEPVKITIPYGFIIELGELFEFTLYRNPSILFVARPEGIEEDPIESEEEFGGTKIEAIVDSQKENSKNKFLNNVKNKKFGDKE